MAKKTPLILRIFVVFITLAFSFWSFGIIGIGTVSAAEINDTFHINLQTTYANGTIQSGTFTFAFNITENSDASCLGPIVYNHTKTNATDSRGIVSLYLPTVGSAGGNLSNLDYNKQYYLCYYRDGVLKDVSQLGRVPYSFRATEVNLSDVSIDSNLTLGSFNISASSGFFTFLGSLANRISNLFAVDVNVSRNLTIGGNLSVNGTTLFVNSNTSKVGMGTGTPEEALDVIGTIQATGPFQTTGSEIIYAGNPLGEVKFYRPASTSDIALYAGAIERLRINGSFGFVGINTTTPKNTLNVFGDINATGTVYSNNLNLTKAYVWVTNGTFLQSGSWNATNESYVPYIGANRNINLGNNNFTVNGSALFVNTNNSKVGVGTTNPAEALDVVGTIQATGPFQTTGSEILYAGNPLGEVKFYRPASTSDIALYAGAIERLRINGSFGYVGINTTTPQNLLNVVGDINATGTVYSNNLNLTRAYVWVTNGTFLQTANWNATNSSYALNQTLTDMWSPFLSTTNVSYLMIDRFNVTNKTYRTMDNVTFPGLFVNASHIATSGVNTTHILDNTILAIDLNSDVNTSMDLRYFTKAQWNVTNESYLKDYGDTATGNYTFDAGTLFIGSDTDRVGIGKLAPTTTLDVNGTINASQMLVNGTAVLTINQWNATNSSYALNQTLTDMWTPFLSTTNASYLMIDRFNVTNKTYRTMDNVTFPGLFVNASHIATSGVNTTHILDNTILAIDLNSDVNTSMDLRYFTKAQWNVTNESYLKDYGDTATGNYTFDAGTLFIGSDTDKVGIGKLAPTTTLDVNGTINASQMLVNGTAVLTIANWNSTNSSYALNQTLTDMWTPFLSTTNSSYLMVDKFNVTNSSYRENYNLTWVGNLNVTQNFSVNNNNLFVDSVTGNVGIGTTGPFTKLTINGTTFAEMDLTNGATALLGNDILGKYSFRSIDADAHVGGDQTLGGMYGVIVHEAGGTAVIDGSADEGFELSFTTAKRPSPNALFTLTEAMRINKLGNVGIGTANPLTALQIGVPDAANTGLRISNLGIVAGTSVIGFGGSSGTQPMSAIGGVVEDAAVLTAGGLYFSTRSATSNTAPTERMRIDKNGNVGIGTTAPSSKLHINTTDNSTTPLQIQGLNATGQQVTLLSIQNVTGNTTSLTDFCISGGKCLSGVISSGAETDPKWTANITNYFTKAQWNVTNASYALNQTLTDMWTPFLSTTNSSYLMIDKFNVTNKTYRTMDNVTFPGLFVNASHIGNSVINASHLTAAMINATHIAISAVNSTHILDNTILAGDLNSDVNASIDLTHFTKAQWNVTNATYLPLYGGTMTGNLNMGNKTIENVFKLTINTGGAVDPPYKIGNITYATYVPSMTGIKEETSGTITLDGDYVIDFNNLENGSDLWLFSQITDFGKDWENLQVILTPGFEGNVWYTKDPVAKTLTIHGSKNGEVSYRMTSSRYDWANWGIIADEQIVGSGFEEIKKAQKPINDKELAKIEAAKKKK